jgi:hypothetical protein
LIYLGLARYCTLCRSNETFTKARRVPTTEIASKSRQNTHPQDQHSRSASLSPPPISISPTPATEVSTPSIPSAISDSLAELPQCSSPVDSRSHPNESISSFSPPPSSHAFHGIYPQSGGFARPFQAHSGLSRNLPSYRTPSIVSTDTSSPSVVHIPRSFGALFTRRRQRDTSGIHSHSPLPSSLCFAFSTSGRNLVLWRKNGHSLIHIKIASWESKSLPLRHTLPTEESDRGINIKLVAEGDGWISAILYHKQVWI